MMEPRVRLASIHETLPLRVCQRQEMNCQIVHDSIHARAGWTVSYLLECDGITVGFGSIAIAGPWKDRPTVFEFYLLPAFRTRAFRLFESFLVVSGARFFEVQSNDELLAVMLHSYGSNVVTESIVFHDSETTSILATGAVLRRVTAVEEIHAAIEARSGGGEWVLDYNGIEAGKGGILFHYNRPYGDIYMEVFEPFRRRGLGAWLVQELKRECYSLGAIPCARCNPTNIPSRQTLQRAGFVPFAHILDADVGLAGGIRNRVGSPGNRVPAIA